MAVAYDTFGGGSGALATTYSYTHTLGAIANGAVLAGFAVDTSTDTGFSVTATFGGVTMTPLALVHCNNATAGFLRVFGLATGSLTGAKTVTATVGGGSPIDMNGGSLSFAGVSQVAPFGTPATGANTGTTASAATGSSKSGNIVGGFMASGSAIASASAPSASKFIDNYRTVADAGAGCSAGAISAATGIGVTMAWTLTADLWAAVAVEVRAPMAGLLPRQQAITLAATR